MMVPCLAGQYHVKSRADMWTAKGMRRILVCWYTYKQNESDRPLWEGILRRAAERVGAESLTFWSDPTPRKPRGKPVTSDLLPELGRAINSIRAVRGAAKKSGEDVLVSFAVPNFGHFAALSIWETVAPKIADLGANAISGEPWAEFDAGDVDAGLELMGERRGRTIGEKKVKARMALGRPKINAAGKRKEAIIRMYGQREDDQGTRIGAGSIAKKFKMAEKTLKRRMEDWTGTDNRGLACCLADDGLWPPKRKLTPRVVGGYKSKYELD